MSPLLFAMVGCFVAALGARDQLIVARLSAVLGRATGLLVVAIACAAASAAAAAWAGGQLSALLSDSAARMFVAFALIAVAAELAWPARLRRPVEPTRSLGAVALVLLARQITDGARFLVAALALALSSPLLAGVGGAIGGMAAVALGWALGDALEARWPLRAMRLMLAAPVFLAGAVMALSARGLI